MRVEAKRWRLQPLMLLVLLHLLLLLLLLLLLPPPPPPLHLTLLQLVPSYPAAPSVGRWTFRRGTPHPHSGRSCSAC